MRPTNTVGIVNCNYYNIKIKNACRIERNQCIFAELTRIYETKKVEQRM